MKPNKGFNFIAAALILAVISNCAHQQTPRAPSDYLLTTDRGVTELLRDVRAKLQENKYRIRREDAAAGLLVTYPRRFSFNSDGNKVLARQTVEVRQEGGSVKLRIIYDCSYDGSGKKFSPCFKEDAAAMTKISRLEPALVELIKPALQRRGGNKKPAENSEEKSDESLEEDWGVSG